MFSSYIARWPEVDRAAILGLLRCVPHAEYPRLRSYSREEVHDGLAGQGGLYLATDMAELLGLKAGMRVLDLGCGSGTSSIMLAREFGAKVYAVDRNADPSDLWARSQSLGLGESVTPLRADALRLPFPASYFDAVFSMNSFFYFGTESTYPVYLASFMKPNGVIAIGGPCYRKELDDSFPSEFLLEYPACLAVHSPEWWQRHFVETRKFKSVESSEHPHGVLFWQDRVARLIEQYAPQDMPDWMQKMVLSMLRIIDHEKSDDVTHFMLSARKG